MSMTKRKPEPIIEEAPAPRKHEHHEKVTFGVLGALGIPPGFQKIRAMNIYDNRWRVNVYTKIGGDDGIVARSSISDSFFLTVDEKGKILTPICKKYQNEPESVPSSE